MNSLSELTKAKDNLYSVKDLSEIDDIINNIESSITDAEDEAEELQDKIDKLENQVDELKEENSELKENSEKYLSMDFINSNHGTIYFSTENLLVDQLMQAFKDCLEELKPIELLQHLQEISSTKIML